MSQYKSARLSRTMTIGELSVKIVAAGLGGEAVDTAVASEFDVEVDYTYSPGHAGNLSGRFEDAEEPLDPECDITAIKASANIHFEGDQCEITIKRGTNMMKLFTGAQIDKLTDEILQARGEE